MLSMAVMDKTHLGDWYDLARLWGMKLLYAICESAHYNTRSGGKDGYRDCVNYRIYVLVILMRTRPLQASKVDDA